MPQGSAAIGIQGIEAIVFGCHDQHIVGALIRNRESPDIERLRVYDSIERGQEELTERSGVYAARSKNCFGQVLPCTGTVVVVSQHINLRRHAHDRSHNYTHPNKKQSSVHFSLTLSLPPLARSHPDLAQLLCANIYGPFIA